MADDIHKEAAFVSRIARHQAGLHAYIISLMPGVDGVDDVLQETNLVLWEKRRTFREGTNFQAWACQIARYKVMSHRRKLANLGYRLFDDELADQLADECVAEPGELDARLEALKKCLGRLREPERQLIEHRYFTKSTLEGFAEKRGQSIETLRVTLFRIRAALKKCISSELNIQRARS